MTNKISRRQLIAGGALLGGIRPRLPSEETDSVQNGSADYNMEITIDKVDYALASGGVRPTRIKFKVKGLEYMFDLGLSSNGSLYVNNGHIIPSKRHGQMKYEDESNLDLSGFGSSPYLELKPSDMPHYRDIIEHWKLISPRFIQSIPHGAWFSGHTSTTYNFPDGTGIEYRAKEIPKNFKPKSGPSIDDKFHSEGCEYISGHPYEQHYRHGRFDFYLEKESVTIEDDKTIQELQDRQPEAVLHLLEFVAAYESPQKALEALSAVAPHSRGRSND